MNYTFISEMTVIFQCYTLTSEHKQAHPSAHQFEFLTIQFYYKQTDAQNWKTGDTTVQISASLSLNTAVGDFIRSLKLLASLFMLVMTDRGRIWGGGVEEGSVFQRLPLCMCAHALYVYVCLYLHKGMWRGIFVRVSALFVCCQQTPLLQ